LHGYSQEALRPPQPAPKADRRASTSSFLYFERAPYAPAEWQNRFWTGMMFTAFGELENVKIITDRYTGQSKGFGYVEMPSNSEADRAIKALNGKFINGRNIKVNPSDPGGKRSKHSRRSVSRNGY
jgi:hypothetical protein